MPFYVPGSICVGRFSQHRFAKYFALLRFTAIGYCVPFTGLVLFRGEALQGNVFVQILRLIKIQEFSFKIDHPVEA
jgi:hypothetical protein